MERALHSWVRWPSAYAMPRFDTRWMLTGSSLAYWLAGSSSVDARRYAFHFYWFSRFIFCRSTSCWVLHHKHRLTLWPLFGANQIGQAQWSKSRNSNTMQRSETAAAENLFQSIPEILCRNGGPRFITKTRRENKCLHISSHKTIESFSSRDQAVAFFFKSCTIFCGECAIPVARETYPDCGQKSFWPSELFIEKNFRSRSF